MREPIHIPRPKYKTPAKLKRIHPKFVLTMPSRARTLAALEIIPPQNMQHIRHAQIGNRIRLPLLINQQRKIDPRFLLENPRVIAVTQTNGRQGSAFRQKRLFVFAQLRDMLSAKYSPIVPQKNDHRPFALPQRTKPNFVPGRIRQHNLRKALAKTLHHAAHHSGFSLTLSIEPFSVPEPSM